MKYLVIGAGYNRDQESDAVYGTNDIQEAIKGEDEIGPGTKVIEQSVRDQYGSLFLLMCLIVAPGFAQGILKSEKGSRLSTSICTSFQDVIYQRKNTLLFESQDYSLPNSRAYYQMIVCQNGTVYTARVIPDWAIQDRQEGKLSFEQLQELRQILTDPFLHQPLSVKESESKEQFSAFLFFDGKDYSRFKYMGSAPIKIQKVQDFVKSEVKKQQNSAFEN